MNRTFSAPNLLFKFEDKVDFGSGKFNFYCLFQILVKREGKNFIVNSELNINCYPFLPFTAMISLLVTISFTRIREQVLLIMLIGEFKPRSA